MKLGPYHHPRFGEVVVYAPRACPARANRVTEREVGVLDPRLAVRGASYQEAIAFGGELVGVPTENCSR